MKYPYNHGYGCGVAQCDKITNRTHTHTTRFGRTAGIPVPVLNPTGTYPEYANGCNFCANTLAYAKFGNGFVQHAYFLTNLKYANKLPRHMSHGYIRTCPPCGLCDCFMTSACLQRPVSSRAWWWPGVSWQQWVSRVSWCSGLRCDWRLVWRGLLPGQLQLSQLWLSWWEKALQMGRTAQKVRCKRLQGK